MNDKRYYWLKLEENYFDLKVQKALRKLPSGADMLICYLKMQLKYLNKSGLIEYQGIYDDVAQEIALDIDEEVDIVKMTLAVLIKWKVIEQEDTNLYLSEMQDRIGSKSDVALRVAKHREKQKMLETPKEAKSNALRQKQHRAKEYCGKNNIPFIEDYINNKRYNGNYYVVLKRDELQCKICHSQENLCVHHIDGFDELKPENSNTNKMITLCRKCHSNIHNENLIINENILESIDYYDESNESNELCNNDVTKCNSIKEIEIEKDIEIDKKENNKKKKFFENDDVNDIFLEFLEMRKKIKAVNSDRAIKTLINQLNNYDDEIKIKMIEQSIVNSWKGIFELKEQHISYRDKKKLEEEKMWEDYLKGGE